MARDRWFPMRYELPGDDTLGKLAYFGPEWQIFSCGKGQHALVAKEDLAQRWLSVGLLAEGVLAAFSFGDDAYRVLLSDKNHILAPVDDCPSPASKSDALAFAVSLKETRKIDGTSPLHDAIYVERYSRLLPTWSISEERSDEEVFGGWLTGGVYVPVSAFRRLSSLMGWVAKDDLHDVIDSAGLNAGNAAGNVKAKLHPRESIENQESKRQEEKAESQAQSTEISEGPFRLHGRSMLENFFRDHVIDIVENAERYKALGIEFPAPIVLHGPPGCGKTFAVERLVEYLDWPIYFIESSSIGSPYIHETSRKVSEIFDKAIDSAPSVIVIDEMESYLSDRQSGSSSGQHRVEEVAEFLRRIPEATKHHVLIIGMTNRLEMIDSAILRRGRFDHVIEVGMPEEREVQDLVDSLLEKVPLDQGVDSSVVIQELVGRPLSDAAFVIREAGRLAAKVGRSALDEDSLNLALKSLPAKEPKRRSIGFIQD